MDLFNDKMHFFSTEFLFVMLFFFFFFNKLDLIRVMGSFLINKKFNNKKSLFANFEIRKKKKKEKK